MKVCSPGPGTFPGRNRNGFVQKQLGPAALAGGLAGSLAQSYASCSYSRSGIKYRRALLRLFCKTVCLVSKSTRSASSDEERSREETR